MLWNAGQGWKRVLGLVAPLCLVAAGDVAPQDELDALERKLTEAWASGQPARLLAPGESLAAFAEAHPQSARAHYLSGLCSMIQVIRTNGSPDTSDNERTLAVLDRAEKSLARAVELDATDANTSDACATLAFCILQRFFLGQATPELGPKLGEWIGRAQSAGTEGSAVRLVSLWLSTNRTMNSPAGVDQAMAQFVELFERIRASIEEEDRAPSFWDLFGQGMAARALIFSPRPQPRRAAELVEALREQRPGLPMAEKFLLPFVTAHEPMASATWLDLAWQDLDVELDPDGGAPGLADAVVVSSVEQGEEVWLRIQLSEPPNEQLFGINVVIDADASAETGSPWWGGNSSFVFDRLISAWVARDDEGKYRGAVGLTDDAGAMQGEMTNLGDGGVGFALDVEGEAFVLRFDRQALGGASARFLVAVGSNAQWNDNLPNEGSFTLER